MSVVSKPALRVLIIVYFRLVVAVNNQWTGILNTGMEYWNDLFSL